MIVDPISLHHAARDETRRQTAVADALRTAARRRADHQDIDRAAQDVHRWQVTT